MFPTIPLGGGIFLPTYFFMISIGFSCGLLYFLYESKKRDLPQHHALDLSILIMIGSFIGARIFHVVYEEPHYYQQDPWAILRIWQGGFVFYGGVLGACILGFLYARVKKLKPSEWLDAFTPVLPPIYAWGRLATLFSGSGFGKPTDLPWAITYPPGTEAPAGIPLHPTPMYSILWNLALWVLVLFLAKKRDSIAFLKPKAHLFYLMVILHALGRLWIEQFRSDARGFNFFHLSISSWISLLLIFGMSFLLLRASLKSAKS